MLLLFAAVAFSSAVQGGQWHWLDPSGRPTVRAYLLGDRPDEPASGLARFVAGEKIGFVDGSGHVVLPAAWDWADRFENGVARVCVGCRSVSVFGHPAVRGGQWGLVDPQGRLTSELSDRPVMRCESRYSGQEAAVVLSRDGKATLSLRGERTQAGCELRELRLRHSPRDEPPSAELTGNATACGDDFLETPRFLIRWNANTKPFAQAQWLRIQQAADCTLTFWDPGWFEMLSTRFR